MIKKRKNQHKHINRQLFEGKSLREQAFWRRGPNSIRKDKQCVNKTFKSWPVSLLTAELCDDVITGFVCWDRCFGPYDHVALLLSSGTETWKKFLFLAVKLHLNVWNMRSDFEGTNALFNLFSDYVVNVLTVGCTKQTAPSWGSGLPVLFIDLSIF